MTFLLLPLMALAAIGFILSLVAHVMAVAGYLPPGGNTIMGLHAGIFVIWIPAVLMFRRVQRDPGERPSWSRTLAGCPAWMPPALTGLFVYAILNFLWGVFAGTPPHHAFGGAVDARTVRLFSGHWMMFYGVGFAILLSAYRKPELLAPARCPD